MLFDTSKTVAVCTFFMVLFSAYIYFIDPYTENGNVLTLVGKNPKKAKI